MLNNWRGPLESEYEGKVTQEWQTAGKLIAIGAVNPKNKNSNGKQFIINTLEFDTPTGKMQRTAICYEGNYNHPDIQSGKAPRMEEGKPYLTTLRFDDAGTPQLQVSHLTNANRATADDFSFLVRSADGTLQMNNVVAEGAPTETGA